MEIEAVPVERHKIYISLERELNPFFSRSFRYWICAFKLNSMGLHVEHFDSVFFSVRIFVSGGRICCGDSLVGSSS